MKNIFKKKVKKVYGFVLVGLVAGVAIGLVLQYASLVKASPAVPNPGHPANQIEPGTFYSGNYTFPQNLTVGGTLYIGSNGDVYSDTSWLRLNQNHTQNIYTPRMIRADGGFQVDGKIVIDNNAGWHRTYGNTGWYNGTYGGGWYMSDSTWVRSYNNKSVYTGGEMQAGTVRANSNLCIGSDCKSSWPSLDTAVETCGYDGCTVYCPSGYVRTGCSGYYKWWECSDTGTVNFWYAQPYGSNGCRCFGGDGLHRCGGSATCYAYCLKISF